jgi:photosystem II stability/assembly factor-like uncharacterized protein
MHLSSNRKADAAAMFVFSACAGLGALLGLSCGPRPAEETHWEFLNGPYARNVSTLLPSRMNGDFLFAGLANGDLYCSTNGGRTWAQRASPAPGFRINQFVEEPEPGSLVYAATDAGLFRSPDSARSWKDLSIVAPSAVHPGVLTLVIDPWKPALLFAGSRGHGIFTSTDRGTTWQAVHDSAGGLLAEADIRAMAIDTGRPDRLVAAAGSRGVFLSEDGGRQWRSITGGSSTTGAAAVRLLLSPDDGRVILFGTDAGSLYRSQTPGGLWSPVRQATAGGSVYSLTQHPTNPRTVIAGTDGGILISTDFGERWRLDDRVLPATPISVVPALFAPHAWYAFGPGIGLQYSPDEGRTWQERETGLGGITTNCLAIDPHTRRIVAATGTVLLNFSPDSSAWIPVRGLSGGGVGSVTFDRFVQGTAYVTTSTGAFRTSDGGETWEPFARSLPFTPTFLISHPWLRTRMLASCRAGVFVSTDKGETWQEARPAGTIPSVLAFTFVPTNAGTILGAAGPRGVLLTSDGGITWESTRFGFGQDTVQHITLDDRDPSLCYAWTTAGGCYRSTNGGLEWNRYSPPWETRDVVVIATDPLSPSSIVVMVNGQSGFVSSSGGTRWQPIVERSLPANPVALAWHADSGTLVAATSNGGIYRITLGSSLLHTGYEGKLP